MYAITKHDINYNDRAMYRKLNHTNWMKKIKIVIIIFYFIFIILISREKIVHHMGLVFKYHMIELPFFYLLHFNLKELKYS